MTKESEKGQSLIEVLIALAIGIMIIGGVTGAFLAIVKTNDLSTKTRNAAVTNDALLDSVRSYADGNWTGLYGLTKGAANRSHLATSTGALVLQSGTESVVIAGITYARSFYVDNVSRDGSGNIQAAYNAPTDDPSTQKVTVETSFPFSGSMRTITASIYVTRWRNFVIDQTNWSGGAGQAGPVTSVNGAFSSSANVDFTTTNGSISPTLTTCNAAVETCEVVSSIYDTGLANSAGFNTFMWRGSQPSGAKVQFKLAVSNNPAGPWTFSPPIAPIAPNVQSAISQSSYNNARYFQYKIIFDTANATPRVDDVLISLSR